MKKYTKTISKAYRLAVNAQNKARQAGRWANGEFPPNHGTVEFNQGVWMTLQLVGNLLQGETSEEDFLEEIETYCKGEE